MGVAVRAAPAHAHVGVSSHRQGSSGGGRGRRVAVRMQGLRRHTHSQHADLPSCSYLNKRLTSSASSARSYPRRGAFSVLCPGWGCNWPEGGVRVGELPAAAAAVSPLPPPPPPPPPAPPRRPPPLSPAFRALLSASNCVRSEKCCFISVARTMSITCTRGGTSKGCHLRMAGKRAEPRQQ